MLALLPHEPCLAALLFFVTLLVLSKPSLQYQAGQDTSGLRHLWGLPYAKEGDASSPWETAIPREKLGEELDLEDKNWFALLDSLTDEQLAQEFEYHDTKGNRYASVRGDIMAHIVNHSTHHRGQISAALTQAGFEPPVLDMPYFLRERAAKEAETKQPWQLISLKDL
eukprot:m.54452 g.54452  ORF g.54452 m.54452 type:complete len:168 (+) comp12870_c0_seq2:303-806(+)